MQDQMRFEDEKVIGLTLMLISLQIIQVAYKKHGKWAFPVFPNNRSLVGSPPTPYIWDDRCSPEDAAEQIMKFIK